MLIRSSVYELSAASINKLLGFFITAFLYRLYTLDEIGKYFLLINILSIFITLVQIGSEKPLINYNIKKKKVDEYKIVKTRILISLILSPFFFLISFNFFETNTLFVSLVMSIVLIITSFNFAYILIAKKKFFYHSLSTTLVQCIVFLFFGLALYFNLKPNIVFHQFIPTFFLHLLCFILALKIIKIDFKKIFFSKLVSVDYFKDNQIIILNCVFIALITSVDLFLAKKILNDSQLGIMAGLYRYSLISFGFLVIINKILYSYAINTSNSKKFKSSSKLLIRIYTFISVLGLAILLYPYLKYIMNLNEISLIVIPGMIITLTSILMPSFFLELNKIETCNHRLSSRPLLIFIISTLLIYYYGGSFLSEIFSDIILYHFLSFMFLIKWILLSLGIYFLRKKYNIN
jgi:O-antigen/teichoic acid export membrane protein